MRLSRTRRVAAAVTGHRRRRAAIGLLVVVMLVVAGAASVAVAQLERRFSDVAADDPDRIAIEWAADAGLTVGYGDGTFGPDDAMTRFEAVTFMERFFDLGLAEGFTRGDMMTLLHAINRDLPLLNRTGCAHSGSVNTIGPFVLLEGHHGVEFWITEPDGSKYKGIMAVHVRWRGTQSPVPLRVLLMTASTRQAHRRVVHGAQGEPRASGSLSRCSPASPPIGRCASRPGVSKKVGP